MVLAVEEVLYLLQHVFLGLSAINSALRVAVSQYIVLGSLADLELVGADLLAFVRYGSTRPTIFHFKYIKCCRPLFHLWSLGVFGSPFFLFHEHDELKGGDSFEEEIDVQDDQIHDQEIEHHDDNEGDPYRYHAC